jgi:magnesium transporter
VDSFFPFVAQINKEVDEIERSLYSDFDNPDAVKVGATEPKPSSDSTLDIVDEKNDDSSITTYDEKPSLSPVISQQHVKTTMFRASPLPISLYIRRARRFLKSKLFKTSTEAGVGEPWISQQANPATRTVYRMAKIRRLVTSLTRLLSTKADLIGQIRKRLVARGEWSLDSDPELYIHLGDIIGQSPPFLINITLSLHHRSHLVSAAESRPLRMVVGPVTPIIPHSTTYPGSQDKGQ